MPPLDLKGKSEPVPAFRLVEVADPGAAVEPRLDSPLVGRERELALLREAFDGTVAERGCRLVTVLGPAGIGKSRLARDFVDTLRGDATVVAGRCLSYGEGLTFWPLREVVQELAGSDDGESSERGAGRIARPAPGERRHRHRRGARGRGARAVGRRRIAQETFWAVRMLLEAAAARRPLVVLFEDIHWGEPTFLELIEHLAGRIRGVPVLIVAAARSDLFDTRPDFAVGVAGATRMDLEPLSGPESRTLIEHLIGDAGVAADLSQRVFSGADGNPLFVEELVRMLVDEHHLEKDETGSPRCGSWHRWPCPPRSTRCWRPASTVSAHPSARWSRPPRWSGDPSEVRPCSSWAAAATAPSSTFSCSHSSGSSSSSRTAGTSRASARSASRTCWYETWPITGS